MASHTAPSGVFAFLRKDDSEKRPKGQEMKRLHLQNKLKHIDQQVENTKVLVYLTFIITYRATVR